MYSRKILFLFFFIGSLALNAQVTIGSDEKPLPGALLDLKQSSTGFSTLGLGMPKVALTTKRSLIDINKGDAARPDPNEHIGLLIYNTTTNDSEKLCPAIHVWDGNQWVPLIKEIEYMTDVRTKADGSKEIISYPIRTFGAAGTWIIANLRATTYADNLNVNKPTNDIQLLSSGITYKTKAYNYPNKDAGVLDQHPEAGLLYTWSAATNGKTILSIDETESIGVGIPNPVPGNIEQVGVQGICPEGWHMPSDKEWNALEMELSNNQTGEYTLNQYVPTPWDPVWNITSLKRGTHGTSMKNAAQQGQSKGLCNGGGFNLFLAGYISPTGSASNYRTVSRMLSSSRHSDTTSNSRILESKSATVDRSMLNYGWFSTVRCKKDVM